MVTAARLRCRLRRWSGELDHRAGTNTLSRFSILTEPPQASASSRAIGRPRPVPLTPPAALPRWKRSKTASSSPASRPGPGRGPRSGPAPDDRDLRCRRRVPDRVLDQRVERPVEVGAAHTAASRSPSLCGGRARLPPRRRSCCQRSACAVGRLARRRTPRPGSRARRRGSGSAARRRSPRDGRPPGSRRRSPRSARRPRAASSRSSSSWRRTPVSGVRS